MKEAAGNWTPNNGELIEGSNFGRLYTKGIFIGVDGDHYVLKTEKGFERYFVIRKLNELYA